MAEVNQNEYVTPQMKLDHEAMEWLRRDPEGRQMLYEIACDPNEGWRLGVAGPVCDDPAEAILAVKVQREGGPWPLSAPNPIAQTIPDAEEQRASARGEGHGGSGTSV